MKLVPIRMYREAVALEQKIISARKKGEPVLPLTDREWEIMKATTTIEEDGIYPLVHVPISFREGE